MNYFYVYIVKCIDGTLYVGHTDNLEQRTVDHNKGTFGGYTSTRKPVILVWSKECSTRDEAFEIERKIKNWSHKKKTGLIKGYWGLLRNGSKKRFKERKSS